MVFGALGSFWLQRTQVEMDLEEVTLERVTKTNAKFVLVLLRCSSVISFSLSHHSLAHSCNHVVLLFASMDASSAGGYPAGLR